MTDATTQLRSSATARGKAAAAKAESESKQQAETKRSGAADAKSVEGLDAASASSAKEQQLGDLVTLSIGGTKFTTTVGTLTNGGKMTNFFSALLSGRIPSTMHGDAYFVDREPDHFGLLKYLRTGKTPQDAALLAAFREEAEFYLVDTDFELQFEDAGGVGDSKAVRSVSDHELRAVVAADSRAKDVADMKANQAAFATIERALLPLLKANPGATLVIAAPPGVGVARQRDYDDSGRPWIRWLYEAASLVGWSTGFSFPLYMKERHNLTVTIQRQHSCPTHGGINSSAAQWSSCCSAQKVAVNVVKWGCQY